MLNICLKDLLERSLTKMIKSRFLFFLMIYSYIASNSVDSLQLKILKQIPIQSRTLPTSISNTLKLPVWPVVGGIVGLIADKISPKAGEEVVKAIGGRVIPISLNGLSPFLLLVHHQHTFVPFDPFRVITNFVLPEGFPAHGHAGFVTATISLEGGLDHRDNDGISMSYSDGDVQWMTAGKGVIHEEMWSVNPSSFQRIELYQLWLNLPKKFKNTDSSVALLKNGSIPIDHFDDVTYRCICGDLNFGGDAIMTGPGNAYAVTPMSILQLKAPSNKLVNIEIINDSDQVRTSVVVHVRRGSIIVGDKEIFHGDVVTSSTPYKTNDIFQVEAGSSGCDLLVLAGDVIPEPVVMNGPFVQCTQEDIDECYKTFQKSDLVYWDHKLTKSEWEDHIKQYPLF